MPDLGRSSPEQGLTDCAGILRGPCEQFKKETLIRQTQSPEDLKCLVDIRQGDIAV
jgi:hypothetical protein